MSSMLNSYTLTRTGTVAWTLGDFAFSTIPTNASISMQVVAVGASMPVTLDVPYFAAVGAGPCPCDAPPMLTGRLPVPG